MEPLMDSSDVWQILVAKEFLSPSAAVTLIVGVLAYILYVSTLHGKQI